MRYLILILLMGFGISAAAQSADKMDKLFKDYLEIKDALTADNSSKAATAAKSFFSTVAAIDSKMLPAEKSAALKKDASNIQQTNDIKKQREYFYGLSDKMIELANEHKIKTGTIYVQYCPMAKGQWLSTKKDIKNPYYGKSMLECGYVTSEIK
ncbi:MAG: DUF3347 domain-containing protein [Moheibacter sp.]